MTHNGRGAYALLADEIVNQGKCGTEIFTEPAARFLGKVRRGFEDQVGIRGQIAKGF